DVLPVGHVGGVPGVPLRDVRDRPQLGQVELPAVDPDAEHEVLVVQLLRFEDGRAAAVDPGPALGVEPVPPEAPAQVGRVDAGEATVRVDVLDPRPDVERVDLRGRFRWYGLYTQRRQIGRAHV